MSEMGKIVFFNFSIFFVRHQEPPEIIDRNLITQLTQLTQLALLTQ